MPTYDLIDEPWIPVLTLAGEPRSVGLREALHRAADFREIRDPAPTVEFGLHRLLTALVIDIYMPDPKIRDVASLEELMEAGRFDSKTADRYFSEFRDRFDLFHPDHPFLQTAGMGGEAPKPLAGLVHLLPSGTNSAHFHHLHESAFAVCPAAAARLLTTVAPFMTAGGAGLSPSINGAPPWYVLLRRKGSTLFQTLCLNCCAYPLSQDRKSGPPAWRRLDSMTKEASKSRLKGASLLESLTWQPRRILLIPGGAGRCSLTGVESSVLVSCMKLAAGASCDFPWTDPSVPYRITHLKGAVAMRPQEGREIWRDTGPIALLTKKDYQSRDGKIQFSRPILLDQFTELVQDHAVSLGEPLELSVYGLRTDMKMKVFEWQREDLAVPGGLVWNSKYHGQVQAAMDAADRVAYLMKQAIKMAYPRDGAGNNAAFEGLISRCQREFWWRVRSPYESLLGALAPLPAEGADAMALQAFGVWEKEVTQAARVVFERAIEDLDADREALKRQVEARNFFFPRLKSVFHPPPPKEKKKGAAAATAG